MSCNEYQDLIIEALYDELDEVRAGHLQAHAAECAECAALLSEMRATLKIMDKRERQDPGQAYWDGYWNRLNARMEDSGQPFGTTHESWWRRNILGGASSRTSWAYRAVAAAAILTIGIFLGRSFGPEPTQLDSGTDQLATTQTQDVSGGLTKGAIDGPPTDAASGNGTPDGATPQRRQRRSGKGMTVEAASADQRAMRYVEKSQMLLLALVNTSDPEDGYAADIDDQRRRSRALLSEAGDIKEGLTDPRQRRLRELVGQLEMILREIANLEAEDDMESVEFIRSNVNRHDIMLKINLEQMRHTTDDTGASDANENDQDVYQ